MADLTQKEMVGEILARAKREGSQAALAKKLGISAAYLSDVCLYRRSPQRIAERLGFEMKMIFRKKASK